MIARLFVFMLLVGINSTRVAGQGVPRVDTGWGVNLDSGAWADRSWQTALPAIYAAWREYLLGNPHLQAPTRLWSAAEQEKWPAYDLTAALAYQGMPATVVDIRPADPAANEFMIQTLFASVSGTERSARPLALTRVWAIRENDRWVLAGALPRLTRSWRRETVGPVMYIIHPEIVFETQRAQRSIAFADSLAKNLGVPGPKDLTYVVAPSPEELHRVMGIDWTIGGRGFGYSLPWNRLILSGSLAFAEENRHELAHYVIGPILEERQTHGIVNEGLASWLGGSRDLSYHALIEEYSSYLRENPSIGLDDVLANEGPDKGWYPAGAVLVEMVYDRGGWTAVRQLLTSGRSTEALRAGLVRLLDLPWPDVTAAWKAKILNRVSRADRR